MDHIDISVIIPTLHREEQLLEAIGSVLRQGGVALEIIVVDDSAEGSARNAVASVGDPRVQYIQRPEPSRGLPALVRNDGAKFARGRYLYFLDDDDLLESDTLAVMSKALDAAPAAGMAFGAVEPFGNDEADLRHNQIYFSEARRIARRVRSAVELRARLMFRASILVNSACMARRTAFFLVGGYDSDIPVCEDTDLYGRIAHATDYVYIDRTVVRYRTGAPSLMHNLAKKDEKLHLSYRRIQGKYRLAKGMLKFLALKIWAKAILR
jgi:glycosyltransferase involved in cell wall biosynthesis